MLNIYVNTWRNYNENGADGGEWVNLPMDENDLEETLERIADRMGDDDAEWFINDYEWTIDDPLRNIDENEDIFELNEEMELLDNLDDYEQKLLMAAVEIWNYDDIDIDSILYDFNLYEDIEDDYDLGYYWIEESGCYNLGELGNLSNYIDYERFGRDIRLECDGGFSSYGWIERA